MTSPSTGKTVLLVEDNPHNRKIFSGMLVHSGFAVVEAEDGHQALAAIGLDKALPDVILMDLSIPGVDGWEVHPAPQGRCAYQAGPDHRADGPRHARRRGARARRRLRPLPGQADLAEEGRRRGAEDPGDGLVMLAM